jgi:hypothetical protein
MRTAALTLLSFVAFGYAAKAQKFSLLPQVGFENSKTNIRFNNTPSFSPAGVIFTPQVSLHLNYSSKSGHGFFAGAGSSRSIVPFRFADPENAMNSFTTNTGKMQLRLEGGYRFSSKPVYLKKQPGAAPKTITYKTAEKKGCGSYSYRGSCGRNRSTTDHASKSAVARHVKGTWLKLQPSFGLGFIPFAKDHLVNVNETGAAKYEYRAGNMRTAVLTGMAIEFGKNNTRQLTVGVNYVRSIGNTETQSIASLNGTKTVTTELRSNVTGWNVKFGIPFTLGAKKPALKQQALQKSTLQKQGCHQYRIQYKCNRTL